MVAVSKEARVPVPQQQLATVTDIVGRPRRASKSIRRTTSAGECVVVELGQRQAAALAVRVPGSVVSYDVAEQESAARRLCSRCGVDFRRCARAAASTICLDCVGVP